MSIEKSMDSSFVAYLKKLGASDSTEALEIYYNTLQLQELPEQNISPVRSFLGLDIIADLTIPDSRKGFWPPTTWISVKLTGWILTTLAISLGAPFWFDLLNKVMKMRSSGSAPKKIENEK